LGFLSFDLPNASTRFTSHPEKMLKNKIEAFLLPQKVISNTNKKYKNT